MFCAPKLGRLSEYVYARTQTPVWVRTCLRSSASILTSNRFYSKSSISSSPFYTKSIWNGRTAFPIQKLLDKSSFKWIASGVNFTGATKRIWNGVSCASALPNRSLGASGESPVLLIFTPSGVSLLFGTPPSGRLTRAKRKIITSCPRAFLSGTSW